MSPTSLTHPDAVDQIMMKIKEHDIKYVRLILIDLDGMPRAVLIPEYEVPKALKEGIGVDGSSMGLVNIENSDITIHPDPSTFLVPMWETPGLALMFCYISNPDGSAFPGDCRGLLRSTLEDLEKKGMGFNTGPELEFFYVTKENGGITPYGLGGYFYLPPNDPTEDIKLETIMNLEAAGFQLDKIHHEVAQGQQEINFRYADALQTADNAILYKLVVKTIANKHGVKATFMPKPFWGMNGSGSHVHQSISDLKTGRNLFGDNKSETGLTPMAYHFIAGILAHSRSMSMVVAPLVNSYKRLVPHWEAPVYIGWGLGNRTALVRVPLYPGEKAKVSRIEYRHPDPSSNPYLVATVLLKSGMDGVKRKLDPPEPHTDNIYHKKDMEMLPENLGEAIDVFEKDSVVTGALGSYMAERLVKSKRAEWESYNKFTGTDWVTSRPRITSWEIDRYLTTC